MFNELQVKIGASEKKIFLRVGTTRFSNHISPVHIHGSTEIHVVAEGYISFMVGKTPYELTAGDILAIPAKMQHLCTNLNDDNYYANFYIDTPLRAPVRTRLDPVIATAFINEYARCLTSENYAKLSAYIALLCCHVFEEETLAAKKLSDYSMAITDYFNRHFADASLTGLAQELCLSEKQTERLVLRYTGRTFKQNVAHHRIRVAEMLFKRGEMSKKEIAEYVGYATYSGFYKALREYGSID